MSMTNGDYSISLNANLDTSKVQKTYNELRNSIQRQELKIPIDVKIDNIMPQLNRNFTEFGQRLDSSLNRINTQISSTTGKINDEFVKLTKSVETYKNSIGDVTERTSIWTEDGKLLASSLNKIQSGVQNITTETKSFVTSLNGVNTKVTEVSKVITDTDGKTKTVIDRTEEWIDANGRLNQQITKTSDKGEQLSATITNISNDSKKAAKLVDELAKATNKITVKDTSKLTYVDKNGVKTVTEFANGVATLTTKTREYTTSQGALVKETITLNAQTKQVLSVNKEIIKDVQKETEARKELDAQIQKEKDDRRKLQQVRH